VGVILNLAVWFGPHVLFAHQTPMRFLGASFLPVLGSVDMLSLVLSLAAAVAIFRCRIGMIPLLLASSMAGVVIYLAIGPSRTIGP